MRLLKSWRIREGIDTRPVFCAVLWVGLLWPGIDAVHARDLGQVGDVYPIVEKNSRERNRQHTPRNNGQPVHVELPLTVTQQEKYLDLSYTVPRDITDDKGNILYPKGYQFNPLAHRRFQPMIVIDGTDTRQLNWATTVKAVSNPMTRIVITKGNKTEVSRYFKRRVYRLHPQVARRYRITSVPTIIQQKGASLAVTSIPVD